MSQGILCVCAWRRLGEHYADCFTDMLTAFTVMELMRFCNQRQSHISTHYDWTQSTNRTMLANTEWGLSETTLSLGVERTDDCSPDLNLTNTCWIRVGMRFGLEWPVQPHWLTCGKWGKKNGIPSHSSAWPRWWQGGGRQLCLCMVLPHAVEASLCSMNKLLNWQYPLVTLDFQYSNKYGHQAWISCLTLAEKV